MTPEGTAARPLDPARADAIAHRIVIADAMQLLLHRLIWLELKGDVGGTEWAATNAQLAAIRAGAPQ